MASFLSDQAYMELALQQANNACAADEVPIGAVLVDTRDGTVVAQAGNRTVMDHDPTAHAEILVIRETCRKQGAQRIPDYDLYVTLEPCPMCAAAISFARIRRVIYGAHDPKSGGLSPGPHGGPCLYSHAQLHHKPQVISGVLADESAALLQRFFQAKRAKQKEERS